MFSKNNDSERKTTYVAVSHWI